MGLSGISRLSGRLSSGSGRQVVIELGLVIMGVLQNTGNPHDTILDGSHGDLPKSANPLYNMKKVQIKGRHRSRNPGSVPTIYM